MIDVSVVTITFRPGYIDTLIQSLEAQTLSRERFEHILVDEMYEWRKEEVRGYAGDRINLVHIPPRLISDKPVTASAINDGIIHARGRLVYFMADYMYLHPRCLERHLYLFDKYGPQVMISGPVVDRVTVADNSVYWGAAIPIVTVRRGALRLTYDEQMAPLDIPLKPDHDYIANHNKISILVNPFVPVWPRRLAPDWRVGSICDVSVEANVWERLGTVTWWWAGRNDSAGRELLLNVNGMDEAFDGCYGGADGDMAIRMKEAGARYLVDTEAPAVILPHPVRKAGAITEEERDKVVARGREAGRINTYSLREERNRILGLSDT